MKESMTENTSLKNIGAMIKAETVRAIKKETGPAPKSADQSEYRDAFTEYGKEMLSPELLHKALFFLQRNWNAFKSRYLPGDRCCLTAIPVSDMGVELDAKAMAANQYLRLMSISGTDGLTREFSFYAARYFELMPETIQKDVSQGGCTFTVEKDESGSYGKSQAAFIRDYRLAFNNLRKFFDLPPLEDVLH